MTDTVLFIGAIIIAITQAIKFLAPNVRGIVTMVTAIVVGIIVALLSTNIGLAHITIAQGILIALGAIGVHSTASAINTNSPRLP